MVERNESSVCRIATVEAARFIAEPRAHFLLMAFVHRPRTVSEAARALGMPLLSAWRLVRRAIDLGLLRQVGEKKRSGRPLKLYQAVAATFLIPDELMPRMPGDILADELRERIRQEMAERGSSHVIKANDGGEPLLTPLSAEGEGELPFEAWRILKLDAARAMALRRDLEELLDRYEAHQGQSGRSFLVHAAMVCRRS